MHLEGTFLTLEVDGSLTNRLVACGFLVWALAVGLLLFLGLRVALRSHQLPPTRLGILAGLLGVTLVATPLVYTALIAALYSMRDQRIVSVGLWDGPSSLWSWLLGASLGSGLALFEHLRIRGSVRPPDRPSRPDP